MLKMEVTVHDEQWPLVTMTVIRESFRSGKVVLQEKKQYDLAYGKLEEMLHNQARPMVEEIVGRHQRTRVGVSE
jgi:hypothetical protein